MSLLDDVLDLFGWAPSPGAQPKSSPKPAKPKPAPRPPNQNAAVQQVFPEPESASPPTDNPAPTRPAPARPKPIGRTEREILSIVSPVAPQIRRVVFTKNRRVMASVAERGTALRLNTAFAVAPEDVLVAVARLFSARDARTRNRARDAVRRFITLIPAESVPPRRTRTRQVLASDRPQIERLLAEFRRVNAAHFGGTLPEVPLYLSGQMRRRNGHFSSTPLEIVISRVLCTHALPAESEATLRHEMIHLWQHAQGKKPDHGPEFRAWARKLDVHPRATRPVKWERKPPK
ncbi:SprT-like domain-containing protein [Longimicrobium sp.]|uniref:SprT-like domain-containing protein n=1 Tax=Longimicrobium sp. TaxID=2029185 RepID=UPI002ED8B73B